MLKKLFVLALAFMMIFSFAACGEETPEQPKETPIPTPTPEPLIMMKDDLLGESSLTYKKLLKAVEPIYEDNVKKADVFEPFDIDGGINASKFFVLKDASLFDCNVLGYKYIDNLDLSYLMATYKEYEGKPYDIEFKGIYLTYKFTCESKEYAFKLMDRDVKALCAFAEVETAETSQEVSQATCDAMLNDGTALKVTVTKNVSAEITVSSINDAIVYQVDVVIK